MQSGNYLGINFIPINCLAEKRIFPKTISYIDPGSRSHFSSFVTHTSIEEIGADIAKQLSFPVIIKRNSGTQGQHVYLCTDLAQIHRSLKRIYSKRQITYDHVALAQEFVEPTREYRLVVFESRLQFAYVKPHHRKKFGGKILAALVKDEDRLGRMRDLILRLSEYHPLVYAGIDVVEMSDGSFKVIEINGSPTYSSFVKACGKDRVIELFVKIIERLVGGKDILHQHGNGHGTDAAGYGTNKTGNLFDSIKVHIPHKA
jgi:glutathione synthase/RimK-type ligase-like ATP-grasp enzyme